MPPYSKFVVQPRNVLLPKRTWPGVRRIVVGFALGALLAAVLGSYAYEFSQGGGSSYQLTYPIVSEDGPTARGRASEGTATTVPFSISTLNVTSVVFELSWTDDVGAPDEFELRVQNQSVRSADGKARLEFASLAIPPGRSRELAPNGEEAAARASAPVAGPAWSVEVLLVSAPGESPVPGVVVRADGQNEWTLSSVVSFYKVDARRG